MPEDFVLDVKCLSDHFLFCKYQLLLQSLDVNKENLLFDPYFRLKSGSFLPNKLVVVVKNV